LQKSYFKEIHMRFRLSLATVGASIFIATIILTTVGCEHDQAMAPVALQPTLSSIQTNIFTPKCVNRGCHNPNGGGAPMSLQTGQSYGAMINVQSGTYAGRLRVNPGNAANSVLYLKVVGDASVGGAGTRMPLGFPALSAAEVSAIQTWINNGAQNN